MKRKENKNKPYNLDSEEQGATHAVNEPFMAYTSMYATSLNLLSMSHKGLEPKAALDFLSLSGFTADEFQETFKTTVKTIQNYVTKNIRLDASLSERLLKAFALFEKGVGVFGNAGSFYSWLNKPAFGLGNQVPYHFMDTVTGITLIEEELVRLEYGALA